MISISKKGRDHLRCYAARSREISGEILSVLPPADVAAFDRVLAAIYEGLLDRWENILAAREGSDG